MSGFGYLTCLWTTGQLFKQRQWYHDQNSCWGKHQNFKLTTTRLWHEYQQAEKISIPLYVYTDRLWFYTQWITSLYTKLP